MIPPFDIFHVEGNDHLKWKATAETLDVARLHIKILMADVKYRITQRFNDFDAFLPRQKASQGTTTDIIGTVDPENSRLVDEAANICTSGRWTAVNARVESLAANPGIDNGWWVQLFGALCFQIFSEYLSLKRAYKEKQDKTSLLAWRARNLLELSVWCLYCSKSRENARRLYEDAGRDVLGIFGAFTKWGTATAQDPEWLNLITGAKQNLSQQALSEGIASPDGPYKEVRDAAVEVGIGDHFKLSHRMLSKFAHPTALRILTQPDEAKEAVQNDIFFSQGCLFFTGAFQAVESQLR